MRFNIVNYRGIKRAEIEVHTFTLIAGPNGVGKSAVAQAIGAVLSGEVMPYNLPKKSALSLVRRGEKQGMVSIENTQGSHATVTWPAATFVSDDGIPASVSTIAVGIESPLTWPEKERIKFFSDFLGAFPDKGQLMKTLGDVLTATEIDILWTHIEAGGWDAAHAHAKETGARFKGQWEQITGDRYGAKKAESYYPAAWSTDIEGHSAEDLSTSVHMAQEWFDAGITDQAVEKALDEKVLADLKAKADLLAERGKTLETAGTKLGKFKTDYETAEKEYNDANRFLLQPGQACPHCKKPLTIEDGQIIIGTVTQDQYNEAIEKITSAKKRADALKEPYHSALAEVKEAERLFHESEEASGRLVAAPAPTSTPSKPAADIEDARRRLATAKDNLQAFQAKRDADAVQTKITRNDTIVGVLAPEGLRAESIATALSVANVKLEKFCDTAKWEPVLFADDCSLWYGETPYLLCSDSEKYRVRATVQTFIAQVQKADMMVFDGADILDQGGRNGLIRLVRGAGIPTAICMTMRREDYEEKVRAIQKIGNAYWLEDGEVA
jgi:hypothetical protein